VAKKTALNPFDVIRGWIDAAKPECEFAGSTPAYFGKWRRRFRPRYRKCLGRWPAQVPPRLRVTDRTRKKDHVRERILYDSSPGVTVPAYILTPLDAKIDRRRPGILAAHGHGRGKADICGVTREKGAAKDVADVERTNQEYAIEAVRRGYVVIAPDWMPFGERSAPPGWGGGHSCNPTDIAWRYFGRPLLTQNIWDAMRAVDILAAHPAVNPRRLGVIGLSYGGTMATHMLINDRRIRAGVVSGYISTIGGDALQRDSGPNTCGAQHVPGLLLYGDIPEMLGLAVPKPVLCEMGKREACFYYPDMKRAYRRLARIYRAAGYPERLAQDSHPGPHRWSGSLAWKWLESWL